MLIAYIFSFAIRMIWVYQFQDNPNFMWNGQLMINTNDGYFFASGVEYLLSGAHADNPRVPIAINSYPGLVYVSYLFAKYTPMSLETTILYLPAIISGLMVIPMIMVGKLIKLPWIGFFAALLGSIAWSYYNRTMIGYYDTDMFSVLLQFTILYFFLLTIYNKDNKNVLWLSSSLLLYPYFYPQGLTIIYAMFILWSLYQFVFQKDEKNSLIFIIVASVSLWAIPIWIKIVLILFLFLFLEKIKDKLDSRKLFYLSLGAIIVFLFFGNVFGLLMEKLSVYLSRGMEQEGLSFYQVIQTVREAGSIPFSTMANRISGSQVGVLLSLAGYVVLVFRHKPFIIALPLIGVGVLSLWAGLRFTVFAVPVAALGAVYLFYVLGELFRDKKLQYVFVVLATVAMLYPNIKHTIAYKVPTVLNKAEVGDLTKLNKISNPKDYTISWWDYGYPIWFYSETSTLIDGGKHHNDNFIISKILQTTSPELAANLSKLAVETYVDSNYSVVSNTIFRNKQKNQLDPNILLTELEDSSYKLPKKTREVYLYLPYRMMNIFPTVMVFGNLDLNTGKKLRNPIFYPINMISNKNNMIAFSNGMVFDMKKGEIDIRGAKRSVKSFIVTQNSNDGKITLKPQSYHMDGELIVVYMKSYGRFVVMDTETFGSMFVQMFILGKYDNNLFEPVVASPYSRIYRVK
ncbi:MAG: peptide-binding protein [Sulfurovum sp.]|nr:peptide-binding protein [Sulfurovum sp.]